MKDEALKKEDEALNTEQEAGTEQTSEAGSGEAGQKLLLIPHRHKKVPWREQRKMQQRKMQSRSLPVKRKKKRDSLRRKRIPGMKR